MATNLIKFHYILREVDFNDAIGVENEILMNLKLFLTKENIYQSLYLF